MSLRITSILVSTYLFSGLIGCSLTNFNEWKKQDYPSLGTKVVVASLIDDYNQALDFNSQNVSLNNSLEIFSNREENYQQLADFYDAIKLNSNDTKNNNICSLPVSASQYNYLNTQTSSLHNYSDHSICTINLFYEIPKGIRQ